MPPPRSKAKRSDIAVGDKVEFQLHGERILAVLDALTEGGKAAVRGLMFSREIVFRDVEVEELVRVGT